MALLGEELAERVRRVALALELREASPLDPDSYREIMDAYRDDTRAMLRRARAYQQEGDPERARALVEAWNNMTIEWRDRAYGRP